MSEPRIKELKFGESPSESKTISMSITQKTKTFLFTDVESGNLKIKLIKRKITTINKDLRDLRREKRTDIKKKPTNIKEETRINKKIQRTRKQMESLEDKRDRQKDKIIVIQGKIKTRVKKDKRDLQIKKKKEFKKAMKSKRVFVKKN